MSETVLSGNIGEWTEVYVFFSVLRDGKLYCTKDDLTLDPDSFLDVLKIIRKGFEDEDFQYCIENGVIFVCPTNNKKFPKVFISKNDLNANAKNVLERIFEHKKNSHGERAFSIPNVQEYMNSIYMDELKAPTSDKSDIQILCYDSKNALTSMNGFSIKSKLGGDATLINASGSTNFRFELDGMSKEMMDMANSIPDTIPRMEYLIQYSIPRFRGAVKKRTKDNLALLDGKYEEIISILLWQSFVQNECNIKKLCKIIDRINPMQSEFKNYFEFKIKKLLITCALGLNLGTKWNGEEDANGGFITVDKKGTIFAYHFFNRTIVENFLFNNTRLERSSRSKHHWGKVFAEDGKFYIDLNLQVRFN